MRFLMSAHTSLTDFVCQRQNEGQNEIPSGIGVVQPVSE